MDVLFRSFCFIDFHEKTFCEVIIVLNSNIPDTSEVCV